MENETADDIIADQNMFARLMLNQFTPSKFRPILNKRMFNFTMNYLEKTTEKDSGKVNGVKDGLTTFAKYNKEDLLTLWKLYEGKNEKLTHVKLGP